MESKITYQIKLVDKSNIDLLLNHLHGLDITNYLTPFKEFIIDKDYIWINERYKGCDDWMGKYRLAIGFCSNLNDIEDGLTINCFKWPQDKELIFENLDHEFSTLASVLNEIRKEYK